jgi:ABC-type sugar transport system permease subunit
MTPQLTWVAAYRIFFALLTLAAIIYQLFHSIDINPDFRVGNFFSFFTIESNIFAAVVLLAFGLNLVGSPPSRTAELVRGAAVLYMVTTGIVYGLLLSGYTDELQTATPWVNNVVHRIFPVVLLADWLIRPPAVRFSFREALVWLTFPIAYLVYSLIRGPIVDWYPYPFLDPDEAGGYAGVAAVAIAIAVGAIVMTWLVTWVGNHLRLATRHESASSA